jgi:ubiquinone/menaquinone biosynthesis C-methylase UbiE
VIHRRFPPIRRGPPTGQAMRPKDSSAARTADVHAPPPQTPRETPDIETASDDYARRFAGPAGEHFLDIQSAALERLLQDLGDSEVLEVGGGHGQLAPTFLKHGCRLTIIGSNDSTHERVRSLFPNAGIACDTGDLLNLPYGDRSFDVVVAVRLIAHIEAWEQLISEMCRVARRSVIIDYASWRSLNALTPVLFRFKKSIERNTRVYTSYLPSRLAAEFARHGFDVTASYGQFFLPMAVHRGLSGALWLRSVERACRATGLTSLFGSPVLLRADRSRVSARARNPRTGQAS